MPVAPRISGICPLAAASAYFMETAMESRIAEVEIKLSFVEELLDAMNLAVFRQQQQIDNLRQEMRSLREQILLSTPAETSNVREEIPPHY